MMLLREQGGNTASEVRLKVAPEAEPVPDAIAVRGKFRGRYPVTAPELCIEILFPDDSLAKALKKASIYRGWGCEMVWIIDPVQRTAWTVSRDFNEPVWIAPDGALRTEGAAIELQKLFAEMGDSIEAANQ